MPSQEEIEQQWQFLTLQRQRLSTLLRQRGNFDPDLLPHDISGGIAEARRNIGQIKSKLRAWGHSVEDNPIDFWEGPKGPISPPEAHFAKDRTTQSQKTSPPSDPSNIARTSGGRRDQIFISYSHADRRWLDRLMVHLKPLVRDENFKVWNDTMIDPGANWRAEIDKALKAAKVALLLVSADFLASDFIARNELPPLLTAAEEEGAVIMPLIIGHCRFTQNQDLARFQAVNSPSQPLADMPRARREAFFVKLTEAVENALHRQDKLSTSTNQIPSSILQPSQPLANIRPDDALTPKLCLKLLMSNEYHDKIAFQQEMSIKQVFLFGISLQNVSEGSVPAEKIDIKVEFHWRGNDLQYSPHFYTDRYGPTTPGWSERRTEITEHNPAELVYHGDQVACAYGHPRDWHRFSIELSEKVSGYFLVRYQISSVTPHTVSEGELRIIMV